MQAHSFNTVDLRDYLRPLRSRWWLVLIIAALATGLTYVYSAGKPKQYVATTTLFLEPAGGEAVASTRDPDRTARNDAVLLRTSAVASLVAKDIKFKGDPRALLGLLSVVPSQGTDFLSINVQGTQAQLTASLANAFARAYVRITDQRARARARRARMQAEQQLDAVPETVATRATRFELAETIQRLKIEESVPQASARQLEQAVVPSVPTGPNPRRNAIFALVLSGVLGIMVAYGLELLDRRLNRVEDVTEHYGRSVLVSIPEAGPDLKDSADGLRLIAPFVEPFRSLRTTLQLHATDSIDEEPGPIGTILVTSAVIGEGKSTVARNLALAYLEAGKSVALVDADMRRPSLASEFGVADAPGLADVLSEELGIGDVMRVMRHGQDRAGPPTSRFGLTLLSSGRLNTDPAALLAGAHVARVVGLLRASHDVVIFDSPPLLAVSDAVALLPIVDGVLLVSRLRITPASAVKQLNELLERVRDVNILGVVVNDVREPTGYGYEER